MKLKWHCGLKGTNKSLARNKNRTVYGIYFNKRGKKGNKLELVVWYDDGKKPSPTVYFLNN